MRIVSWNCQGGFRKKIEPVLDLTPDILIIQECEQIEKLQFPSEREPSFVWRSEGNRNKGLAVFGFGNLAIRHTGTKHTDFSHIVPFSVASETESYTLFAVWAMASKSNKLERYIGQVWKAICHYQQLLQEGSIIMIGDFNSNKIWDYKPRIANHSAVINCLKRSKIHSLYHEQEQ